MRQLFYKQCLFCRRDFQTYYKSKLFCEDKCQRLDKEVYPNAPLYKKEKPSNNDLYYALDSLKNKAFKQIIP